MDNKLNSNTPAEYEILPGKRDIWKWPFARNSIWNTPIGENAEYKPAGLRPSAAFTFDLEFHYTTTEDDDYLEICYDKGGGGRWPSDEYLIHTGRYMYWPKGMTCAQAEGNTCSAVLQPDGRTLIQLQPTVRDDPNSKHIIGYERMNVDIYGDGTYGTHWGSGLSGFGGTIRVGELSSDEPIRHALKLNVCGNRFLYYNENGVKGFRWPADRSDSCAKNPVKHPFRYSGVNPDITMGTLLAIPPEITPEQLGLRSPFAIKLFHAMQDYGVYIVDNAGWNSYDFSIEYGVKEEIEQLYGMRTCGWTMESETKGERDYVHDLMIMVQRLCVINNNTPDSIGGGGKPRAPLAPDYE